MYLEYIIYICLTVIIFITFIAILDHRINELTSTLDNKYPIAIVRKANWTYIIDDIYRCPHCGFTDHNCNEYKFCPQCGSKMDKADKI